MGKKELRQSTPEQEAIRQRLQELHSALLNLHKALVDSEKVVYEKNVSPIQSPNHFFQLLANDSYFAWLRPISQLIVAIDETLDAKEQLTNASVDSLMRQSVFLLASARREHRPLRRALRRCVAARPPCDSRARASGEANRFRETANLIH